MSQPAFMTWDGLLQRALDNPAAEAEINRRYGRPVAILVCDFNGMVKRTDACGIVYALALARQAERVMEPVLNEHGGEVVKREADTLFVVFEEPLPALMGALEAGKALAVFNKDRTGHIHDRDRRDPIHPCIGLGYGESLVIPGHDMYGGEVNRAFVLGEDVANSREILVTDAFLAALGTLPEGLGSHRAPADRVEEAGFPFHILGDYRD